MAVAFRSSSTFPEDLVSVVDIAVPSGAAADDIALVGIGRWTSGTFGTITPPSGFTLVASQEAADSGTTRMDVFVKRLTAADSGTWDFSNSTADWSSAGAMLLTGGLTSGDPVEDFDTAIGADDGTWPTTTVTVSTAAFLGHFGRHDGSSGSGTPPTDFTEAEDIDWIKVNYRVLSTDGTFDAEGGSVPDQLAVVLVAIEAESGAQSIEIGLTAETETAQAVTVVRTFAVGQATETETALAVTHSKSVTLGQAVETETAQAVGRAKALTVGQPAETETALMVSSAGLFEQVTETETAQAISPVKTVTLGQATESETALGPVEKTAGLVVDLGQATETETAFAISRTKVATLGQVREEADAQPINIPDPKFRLINPTRTEKWPIDANDMRGPTFKYNVGLTVYGDDSGLVADEMPAAAVTEAAKYVFYGGYDHVTTDKTVRDLWRDAGFEVENVPWVEVS